MDCILLNSRTCGGRQLMRGKARTFRWIAWIATLLVGGTFTLAASAEDLGPSSGSVAPDIGTRLDQNGKPRTFADLAGQNGLILSFFRSADWCPFCQAQLIDLNGGLTEVEKRGYHIAALSYDS